MRIGIDVGGTNTDAVLMNGRTVVHAIKTPTTDDVSEGIVQALQLLLDKSGIDVVELEAVMIGTTHFTNAVIERRHLQPTACVRLGLPATMELPPMVDWPDDLRRLVGDKHYLSHGGNEFDGRPISTFDPREIEKIAEDIKAKGIRSVAVSAVFSLVNDHDEKEAAKIIQRIIPDATLTESHVFGKIGLLERENAAILNACLNDLAARTMRGFKQAITQLNIDASLFISQNDGALMNADFAMKYPVLTFSSGPTNSMRGAAFLSNLQDAIVVDVGGTTTDIGVLQHGFPRNSALVAEVGEVRTSFRMPDTISIGLGGGSIVDLDKLTVGPQSVGYRITDEAFIFGGGVLTSTDVMVASGNVAIGDAKLVAHIKPETVAVVKQLMADKIDLAVDSMKTSAADMPVIVVGGGSIIVQHKIKGASEIIKPEHYAVANAIGAAIAQISGNCDRVFSLADVSREDALLEAKNIATQHAIAAGADPDTVSIVEVEEVPLAYLPNNATRIMTKAVGDLKIKN